MVGACLQGFPTCPSLPSSGFGTVLRYELVFTLLPAQADDEAAAISVVLCWSFTTPRGEQVA